MPDPIKIHPRNVAARRSAGGAVPVLASGNAAASLLESAVGNCFPGLECDLRNLERRFFPHLVFELNASVPVVAAVDVTGVEASVAAGGLSAGDAAIYAEIASTLSEGWIVERMAGDFGPLGMLDFALDQLDGNSLGQGRLPSSAWTAVRLLKEGSLVTLTFSGPSGSRALSGRRMPYLDPDGALSRIFEVGELTQSLCSPWTHDFRDCQCYYWASNHPDIAQPPRPEGSGDEVSWNLDTRWQREDRSLSAPPVERRDGPRGIRELRHHEISTEWQSLNFVVERREQILPYAEREHRAEPLADRAQLLEHLRFAAGVELAIMQEYLVAAWSLRPPGGLATGLRDDVRASKAELIRIAIGEMRHLRGVNAVLRALEPATPFRPALAVAAVIPDAAGFRPVSARPLTAAVIEAFIAIEAPSTSVDSVYGRIAASLAEFGLPDEQQQAIRTIMAEGEEHWQTFRMIRHWLGRHPEASYLRNVGMAPAPAGNGAQQELQRRYEALLDTLHRSYERGLPAAAGTLNAARQAMLGPAGIEGALDAVADQGFLPVCGPVADPRFAAIGPPAA
jgi:hypothetical protein